MPVFAAYVGYEHWWNRRTRSTFTWGTVIVDNLEIQDPESYHLTHRASINLVCSPISRLDVVTEFLCGIRRNKNGQQGGSSQLQIGTRLVF